VLYGAQTVFEEIISRQVEGMLVSFEQQTIASARKLAVK
jgi:hypothetical protein